MQDWEHSLVQKQWPRYLYRVMPSALCLHPPRAEHTAGNWSGGAYIQGSRDEKQAKSKSVCITPSFHTRARATPQHIKKVELSSPRSTLSIF